MKVPGLKCPACARVLNRMSMDAGRRGYQARCINGHQWRVNRFADSAGTRHVTLRYDEGRGGPI